MAGRDLLRKKGVLAVLAMCLCPASIIVAQKDSGTSNAKPSALKASRAQLSRAQTAKPVFQSLASAPLAFEENRGQAVAGVKFLSRGKGYALALTEDEAILALAKKKLTANRSQLAANKEQRSASEAVLLRMSFAGGEKAAVEGTEPLPGKVFYVTDFSKKGPLEGHRTFRRVRYAGVYTGIDAIYHGENERLEFDFIVAPHTDPNQIRLEFSGTEQIRLEVNGELVLRVAGEEVRLLKPVIYQERDGARHEIRGGFLLHEDSSASFTVGDYDPSLPLVIDPTIDFATYIGSGAFDDVRALETDTTGAIYILGNLGDVVSGGATISFPLWQTFSDFFTGSGTAGCSLAKLRPDGSGGVNYDFVALIPSLGCEAMAVAPNGDVTIAGPNGLPLQTVVQTFEDSGGSLNRTSLFHIPLQSTRQLRVDSAGKIYALGLCSQEATPGTFYPLPGGFQDSPTTGLCDDPNAIAGTNSQFLLLVTDGAGQISYGTVLGNASSAMDATALEIDAFGKAYIAGQTDAGLNFVTADAFQSQPGDTNCSSNCGPGDAFLMVIDPAQTDLASLSYSSYFGGTNLEGDISMVLDPAGVVYLAGNTDSRASFPGAAFNDNAIFLSRLDLSQQGANQLLSTVAIVEGPITTLLPWLESGPTLRMLSNGWVALMADSTDSSFPLVNALFSGPYDPNAPNPLRPLLLVYDPANSTFPLATFLDDVQLARFPHIAAFGADNLYVAMTTTETNRSTDSSPTFGAGDVLLFGISGISGSGGGGNQPPTVTIPFFTPVLYADSPSGVTLNLTAQAFDPEGDPLTYSWSGPFTDSPVTTNSNLTARLGLGSQQTVSVTVTDDHGNSASASIWVDVIGASCLGGAATPVDSSTNAGVFQYAPLTFTAAGSTAGNCQAFLTTRLDQNPPIPSNLQAGSPPIYFEVSYSGASLVVPIDVCIDTRGMSFPNSASIRLYQFDQSGQLAFWNDITTAGYPQGNQVCGRTNTLGTFAIFYPPVPQTAVETIAGNGIRVGEVDGPGGNPADDFVPGPAPSTPLGYLGTGAYDRANNVLYFTQLGGYISKLDMNTNTVSNVGGSGIQILGQMDGPGGDLRDDLVDGGDPFATFIGQPLEIALDPASGHLYFFDRYTCRIRKLDFAQNLVFNFAGNGNCGFSGDGSPATQAALSLSNLAFDAAGNLFLADSQHGRVRRVDGATGVISTVAGDGSFGIPVSGSPFATIGPVQALAFDKQGHLLISNGTDLMRISPGADGLIDGSMDETLTLINGCHTNCQQPFGGDGLPINDPTVFLAQVRNISVAQDGAVLLNDGFRIRRIQPGADGVVTGAGDEIIQTVASYFDFRPNPPANFNGDTFATQSYLGPFHSAFDDIQGRVLVVDANNYRIRRFGLAPPPVNPNSADLQITVVGSPDPLNTGDVLTYNINVTNHGPANATGVMMTYALPVEAFFDSVSSGQVSCATPAVGSSGTVTCDFGALASGSSNSIIVTVKSQTPGTLSSLFSVAANEPESNPADNSVAVATTVNLAPAVINITENIVVTDAPGVLPSAMIGVNENIVVADAPNVLPSAMIGVSENIVVTDMPSVSPQDSTPPVVTPPTDIVTPATEAAGARGNVSLALHDFLLGGSATDDSGAAPTRLTPQVNGANVDDNFLFPVGPTQVTFRFEDAAGNVGTATATVTVNPPIGGSVQVGGAPVTPTDSNNNPMPIEITFSGVAQPGLVTANPIVPPPAAPTGFQFFGFVFDIATTAIFAPPIEVCINGTGFTSADRLYHLENGQWLDITVMATATRVCGVTNSLSPFGVAQPLDTAPPVLALPANITAEATGPTGAVVNFVATANDATDGTRPVTCSPASGATFALGTSTVNCSASDAAGNTARGNFTVTVQDTTGPVLSLPGNITVNATNSAGAVVNYTASAHDAVDGSRPVTCSPASGSTFPVGTTTVNCSSSDTRGNSSNRSFAVTVQAQSGGVPAPVLTQLSPTSGKRGTDMMLYVSGRNIRLGATLQISGTGVQAISFTRISDSYGIAYVRIAANAATGARQVTVTTAGGVSNALNFSVQ